MIKKYTETARTGTEKYPSNIQIVWSVKFLADIDVAENQVGNFSDQVKHRRLNFRLNTGHSRLSQFSEQVKCIESH